MWTSSPPTTWRPAAGGTFAFDGARRCLDRCPPGDGAFWWANRGDSINTRLTREFDLRGRQRDAQFLDLVRDRVRLGLRLRRRLDGRRGDMDGPARDHTRRTSTR